MGRKYEGGTVMNFQIKDHILKSFGKGELRRNIQDLGDLDFLYSPVTKEQQSCPVIVEGCVKHWPAMTKWSQNSLLQRFGDIPFAAGSADFPLKLFYAYASSNTDDVPMFIFDKYFSERAPELLEDYKVPRIFEGRSSSEKAKTFSDLLCYVSTPELWQVL